MTLIKLVNLTSSPYKSQLEHGEYLVTIFIKLMLVYHLNTPI